MKPKSVAIVGASKKIGMGGMACTHVVKSVISDHVYFVNPKYDEMYDRKCYHSLEELPEVVDCVMICTPAKTVAPYILEAGKLGIKSAVAVASGFSEERTPEAQRLAAEVKEACEKTGVRLCGPNCVGIINTVDKICVSPDDSGLLDRGIAKGIGLVAHSGFVTSGIINHAPNNMAYVVSCGNCTDVSLEDYMLYFAEDDRVNCIAAYVEGIRKPEVLEKALRLAAEKKKPVVVLKSGISQKGSFAAASHTGSIAGDYATIASVFGKYGVIVCKSFQEFAETCKMFAVLGSNLPKGTRVAGINFSGGENTIFADSAERYGIELPDFSDETRAAVKEIVPPYATVSNPIDTTTTMFFDIEAVKKVFVSISDDPAIDLLCVGSDIGEVSEPKDITTNKVLISLKKEARIKPVLIIPSFEKARNKEIYGSYEKAGIPVLSTGDLAFQAVRHLCDFVSFITNETNLSLALPEFVSGDTVALSEADSKAEIEKLGVRVPRQTKAASAEELKDALAGIPFPVVLKVDSPDIMHKTDAGGVKLNLRTEQDCRRAFEEIMTSCRAYKPVAVIHGVLVQEMVPSGAEIIIGVKNDRQFGPMLMVGLGGVFVELFKDVSLYPCPITKTDAQNMLKKLKGYKLLTGFRGSAPCDIEALCDLMLKISQYAVQQKDVIKEMDLNPVFVYEAGQGICVTDALIVKAQ